MAFAATEGAEVEAFVLVSGGALGNCLSASHIPVNAKDFVVGGGKAETWVAFRPCKLSVGKFCRRGGREVKENGVPLMSANEADGRRG